MARGGRAENSGLAGATEPVVAFDGSSLTPSRLRRMLATLARLIFGTQSRIPGGERRHHPDRLTIRPFSHPHGAMSQIPPFSGSHSFTPAEACASDRQ